MKKVMFISAFIFVFSYVSISLNNFSYAGHNGNEKNYTITITNVTSNQVFTTPIVVIHDKSFQLFTLGKESIEGLALLAEDGSLSTLQSFLDTQTGVVEHTIAPSGIAPGSSVSFEIKTEGQTKNISMAAMLASTNDAFFAVNNEKLPDYGELHIMAYAYDAGSEANSESCEFVPGPPCGSHLARDTENAEGFVYLHTGIHGGAGLEPSIYDWRGPVASVVINVLR